MWSPLILFEKARSIESNGMVCISQLKPIYETLQPNVREIMEKERNGIHGLRFWQIQGRHALCTKRAYICEHMFILALQSAVK